MRHETRNIILVNDKCNVIHETSATRHENDKYEMRYVEDNVDIARDSVVLEQALHIA